MEETIKKVQCLQRKLESYSGKLNSWSKQHMEKLEMKDRMEKKECLSGEEIDNEICFENTGLSFGDCLFSEPPATTKLKPTGGSKKRTLPVQEKHKLHENKENVPSSHKRIKDCYNASIYKSLHRTADKPSSRKRSQAVSSHQILFKGAKESRTKVFSGRARVYLTAVPTLFDACLRVVHDNIDLLEDVGGVPFDILRPVLERCTFQQLYKLEAYNPHFIEDSDNLWQKHVKKEFKLSKPIRAETWKQCYLRSFDEREQKLKSLSNRINASYAKKDTGVKVIAPMMQKKQGKRYCLRN